jgi:Calcineurin-like phosphoesterase/PilZ domain
VSSSPDRLVAIGDVHGCASELLTLLDRIDPDPGTTLVFVGDYIDRGPHSRQVIDVVLGVSQRCRVAALRGNHEAMLLDFLFDRNVETAGLFVFNGGGATLASYADEDGDYAVPAAHLTFLSNLELIHQTEDFFFVHAGVPDLPLEAIDPELHARTLLWSRDFLDSEYRWSKVVVHGHSRVDRVELLPHRINVDTGCAYDNRLSAVELPSRRVFSVKRGERIRTTLLTEKGSRRRAVRFKGAISVEIQKGPKTTRFETLDFSPIGLFIRLVSKTEHEPLKVNDVVFGTIGTGTVGLVKFRGRVVRRLSNQEGLFYGLEITHHE